MASIKDVAKKAGVSISTVSYVISGDRPVSQKTKDLVHRTMEEIGYRPHAVARALASRRSRILALVLPPQERALGITELDLITRASKRALEKGYHLVLWTVGDDQIMDLEDLTGQGLADGLILMEIRDRDPRVEWLRQSGFPFEIIGRCSSTEGLSYTDIDFRSTVRDAMAYLKGLGHRRIALINQSEEAFASGYGPVIRVHGDFLACAAELGMEGTRLFAHPNPTDGYRVMEKLTEEVPGATALLVMNDGAIPGILRAVSDSGRRIPEDFSLISLVSSSRFAEMMVPALTEMEVPVTELMGDAVDSLIDRLEGRANEANGRLWPCTLRTRKSTAFVRDE